MKNLKFRGFFLCLALSTSWASAQPAPTATPGENQEKEFSQGGIFLNPIAIGLSFLEYPSDVQSELNLIKQIPTMQQKNLSVDLFGIYFPIEPGRQFLLGFDLNGVGDVYWTNHPAQTTYVLQYLYSASLMFFPERIGNGFFFRADLGDARILAENDQIGFKAQGSGVGFLIGIGAAVPLSNGFRLLVGGNYSVRSIGLDSSNLQDNGVVENGTYGNWGLTLGSLF